MGGEEEEEGDRIRDYRRAEPGTSDWVFGLASHQIRSRKCLISASHTALN